MAGEQQTNKRYKQSYMLTGVMLLFINFPYYIEVVKRQPPSWQM